MCIRIEYVFRREEKQEKETTCQLANFCMTIDEFQAVLLAGGAGDRLYPLADVIPKALLPIANKPMIHYPLCYLEQCAPNINEVIVVYTKKVATQISEYFQNSYQGSLQIKSVEVDDGTDSLDALKAVHKFITVSSQVYSQGRRIL